MTFRKKIDTFLNWYRGKLKRDVAPGEKITVQVRLPGIDTPGRYRVVFDVIAEGVLWFAHQSTNSGAADRRDMRAHYPDSMIQGHVSLIHRLLH